MDIKVPLKMLKFGHEDGEGINARVAGRDDGIAALAANLNANGQIENLSSRMPATASFRSPTATGASPRSA
jgi:hypothetical protein